ncbi:SET and MYND domain-containing protein 5 [Savitreella phatthalungensis]
MIQCPQDLFICDSIHVGESSLGGRGVFAKSSIAEGELLVIAEPLAFSPADADEGPAEHLTSNFDLQGNTAFQVEQYNAITVEASEIELPALPQCQLVVDEGTAIYHLPSFFNHSCDHSCSRTFRGNRIYIRANRDIAAGEELTMAYCSKYMTRARRAQVLEAYGFTCTCKLCKRQASQVDVLARLVHLPENELYIRLQEHIDDVPLSACNALVGIARKRGNTQDVVRWTQRLLDHAGQDDLAIACCLHLLNFGDEDDDGSIVKRLARAWKVRAASSTSYDEFALAWGQSSALQPLLST